MKQQKAESAKRAEQKATLRREKLAGYFFNLSQLTFAALVIGGIAPIFSDKTGWMDYSAIALGVVGTYTFAAFANKLLKQ